MNLLSMWEPSYSDISTLSNWEAVHFLFLVILILVGFSRMEYLLTRKAGKPKDGDK